MELLRILHLGFTKVKKSPGPMELLRILHLGFAFRVDIGLKIPRPHGTTTHTSFRVYIGYKIPRPDGTTTHTSFRVCI